MRARGLLWAAMWTLAGCGLLPSDDVAERETTEERLERMPSSDLVDPASDLVLNTIIASVPDISDDQLTRVTELYIAFRDDQQDLAESDYGHPKVPRTDGRAGSGGRGSDERPGAGRRGADRRGGAQSAPDEARKGGAAAPAPQRPRAQAAPDAGRGAGGERGGSKADRNAGGAERGARTGRGRAPEPDALLQRRLDELAKAFLADGRAQLDSTQHEGWDACAAVVDLAPRPNKGTRAKPEPPLGEIAPNFTLKTLEGGTVSLADFRGKPLVIEFGSYTCPVFRSEVEPLAQLADQLGDEVAWLLVYTREAHPIDGWVVDENEEAGIRYAQPTSWDERAAIARDAVSALDIDMPVGVDEMNDAVSRPWSGAPNRGYVLDADGRVTARQYWIRAADVEIELARLSAP